MWELTKNGKRKRDPWTKRSGLVLKNLRNGDLLYWRAGFEGGATLGNLIVTYTGGVREHPGIMPDVTLGFVKSYDFNGEVQLKPALTPTGEWGPFGEGQGAPRIPTEAKLIMLAKAKERGQFAADDGTKKIGDTLDDEIPF